MSIDAITLDLIKMGTAVIAACTASGFGGWLLARSRDRRPFDDEPAPAARDHVGSHRRGSVPATTSTLPVQPTEHAPPWQAAPVPAGPAASMLPAAGRSPDWQPQMTLPAGAIEPLPVHPPVHQPPVPAAPSPAAGPQLPDYAIAALGGRTVDEVVDSAFSRAMAMDVAELIRGGAL
jgi:hypothetical protein